MRINVLKNKELIIFDFDGTIVDFNLDYLSLRSEIINFLKYSFNVPLNLLSIKQRIFVTLDKVENYFLVNNLDIDWKRILSDIDNIMKKWEWKAAKKNEIDETVIETLKKIKISGLKIAIFTLEPKEIIEYLIKRHNIGHLIDFIAARDNVKKLKPNPDHLEIILERFNIKPEKVVVIGDHKMDMICGKSIKALCIGKKSKFHTDEELINAGASFIISQISDLKELFNI